MNTFGRLFRVTTFGESHGAALGAVIDGCPAGVVMSEAHIQQALDRRRPGQSELTTVRNEADQVEVVSGIFEGKTLGTPIAALVRNTNQRSEDYDTLKTIDRKGHADAVWRERFQHRDHRGGGRTSARETVGRVIGGAVAEGFLKREIPDLGIVGWVSQVGSIKAPEPPHSLQRHDVDSHATRCPHPHSAEAMAAVILEAKMRGDSWGGAVDVRINGLPRGMGEPVFGKLKALLASGLGSIGAVTGVVWGSDAMTSVEKPGSAFHGGDDDVYGGIQGGLANGSPAHLRVFFKPPATLAEHAKGGRHDPCVLPRAVPIVEAMTALVVADLWLHMLAFPHRA